MNPLLTVEEAADRLRISVDELLTSRARGLPPGTFGFKEYPGGPLVFRRTDLLPPPQRKLRCSDCGFIAKTKGGLATHRRKHG